MHQNKGRWIKLTIKTSFLINQKQKNKQGWSGHSATILGRTKFKGIWDPLNAISMALCNILNSNLQNVDPTTPTLSWGRGKLLIIPTLLARIVCENWVWFSEVRLAIKLNVYWNNDRAFVPHGWYDFVASFFVVFFIWWGIVLKKLMLHGQGEFFWGGLCIFYWG